MFLPALVMLRNNLLRRASWTFSVHQAQYGNKEPMPLTRLHVIGRRVARGDLELHDNVVSRGSACRHVDRIGRNKERLIVRLKSAANRKTRVRPRSQ